MALLPILELPGRFWNALRTVEDLLKLQDKTANAMDALEDRLRALEDRMTHLEAAQGRLVTEAKAAAGLAATGLAGSVIAEVVTRVTRIEMRQEEIQRRLLPPMP
jgi:hypothetical protein